MCDFVFALLYNLILAAIWAQVPWIPTYPHSRPAQARDDGVSSMDSDLPAIDIVDHTQSELPNLDDGSFDLAGSNNGVIPGLD